MLDKFKTTLETRPLLVKNAVIGTGVVVGLVAATAAVLMIGATIDEDEEEDFDVEDIE